jgi:hypothetical protein
MVLVATTTMRHPQLLQDMRTMSTVQGLNKKNHREAPPASHPDQAMGLHWYGLCGSIPRIQGVQLPLGHNLSNDEYGTPRTSTYKDESVGTLMDIPQGDSPITWTT